jgi:hypothetical protein
MHESNHIRDSLHGVKSFEVEPAFFAQVIEK